MHHVKLQTNRDLFEYLLWLANELQAHGEAQLAKDLTLASRFASGSASEFLHEAHEALRKVECSDRAVLTTEQYNDVRAAIAQINEAFRKIGGA